MLKITVTERRHFLRSHTVKDQVHEIHDPVCDRIPVSCASGMRQFISTVPPDRPHVPIAGDRWGMDHLHHS
jgi:hypothetical protein